ncbi:MAG: ATP--guanido phosphotransferase [Planctomycetia bacterium]|nr:ATP--guanido phosphotransferase [Planctomycetia bacterium]
MNLDFLVNQPSPWLRDDAKDADVVLASRIRLARNLSSVPFTPRANDADLQEVAVQVTNACKKLWENQRAIVVDGAKLSELDAQLLLERKLASIEFVESQRPKALVFESTEESAVMVNDEDHVRLHAIQAGLCLSALWDKLNEIDDKLSESLDYAYDKQFGYLTASPGNVGTGMRVTVLLHLPALIETGEMDKTIRSLNKMNLLVKGLFGDGEKAFGECIIIGNKATLGMPEEAIVDLLNDVVPHIVEYERKARQVVMQENREKFLDRCFRAVGLLNTARTMTFEEAVAHLSSLRLGARLNLIDNIPIKLIDTTLMQIQPAHLRKHAELDGNDQDDEEILRAEYLRRVLAHTK